MGVSRCRGSLLAVVVNLAVSPGCAQDARTAADEPPAPRREFRGAWVATVANIDWPSAPGLPVVQQQRELDAILDAALDLRLNALVFQVRPAGDALYRSELEPWSEWLTGKQGVAPAPEWDPLEHAVRGAHARGIELHAWFNPFRARHRGAKSPLAAGHFAQTRGMAVEYGDWLWFDPGVADVRQHTLRVILDVVRRYDVDGVHIDDYFYPYPESGRPFPDDASFAAYRQQGGELPRADWRRANVDGFVERLYSAVKREKGWVKVGISPFGIVRPGVPDGIQAGVDQYADLYADVRRWLREGWCDYVAPQLYWPIAQRPQSYARLLDYWAGIKPDHVHLWIGNNTIQAVSGARGWSVDELLEQLGLTREQPRATGNVHYSMKALRDDMRGISRRLREGPYATAALVPASTWLDAVPPARPDLSVRERDGDLEVRWNADQDAFLHPVYLRCDATWLLIEVVGGGKPGLLLTRAQRDKLGVTAVAVSAVDRFGNESERALRDVAR
ncbi:MAG: family 10 glycosylhydrolase [Planctomycetes bacterium]|nr:family 10 glycosylhydrolase [Planctomycetota bacterium]